LLDAQVGDVERWNMHVVGTVLMPERTMALRARQGQIVQLQFVPLVPAQRSMEGASYNRLLSLAKYILKAISHFHDICREVYVLLWGN
jgi:hypothetical protein